MDDSTPAARRGMEPHAAACRPALPTGVATFLFTDMEGSTRLLEGSPVAYRDALTRHNEILDRAIREHGGVVFEQAGDSYAAAFSSPNAAVRAALDAQHGLQHVPWQPLASIQVRMGLATVAVVQGDYEAARPPSAQVMLDRMLELAREALTPSRADAAWRAGRAFTLDEAIASALTIAEPAGQPDQPGSAPAGDPGAAASGLTRREQDVAVLIARGLTNRQIAARLVIGEGTVATHVVHILNKLAFQNRAQVAGWAFEVGLVAGADVP